MSGIPENTSYSPKSFTNLANFNPKAAILAPSSSGSGAAPSSAALKSYRLTPFKEESPKTSAPTLTPYDVPANLPVSGNLPALPTSATPAPTDYASWSNPNEVPVGAKFSNLSAQLGGGQFTQTPTGATDSSVKSTEMGNDVTRASYIPGIAGTGSGAMQIDHIVPVFLGGTDTDDNKEVLGIKDHLQKTKTQEVIRALYNSKTIGKNEALTYALNWQNLSGADQVDLTPVVNSSGAQTMNLDTAKKIFNQWKNPSTNLGFIGTIKAIKDNWGDAVKKVQTAVNKEAVKIVPPATWDFIKGITEGYTGGWIQAGETPGEAYGAGTVGKIDKTIGGVAKFAGNMVGSIAAWMTLERVLQKGLGAVAAKFTGSALGKAAGATEKYVFSSAVKTAALGAGEKAVAEKATTAAGKALAETTANATKSAVAKQGTAEATQIVKSGLAKMVASRDLGKLITRNVVVSQVFGQLSKPIEGESRTTRLMSDTVNGLIFGITPPGLKNAYIPAVLGAASTYIASGDSTAALQTGLMFGGMHAMGSIGGKKSEDSIVADAMKIAHENAAEHIKSITGRDLPIMPGPKAPIKTVNAYKAMIDNEIQNAIDIGTRTGKITLTNSANEIKRLKVVGQVLKGEVDMQSVGWREFGKNAEKDWAAFNTKETPATSALSVHDGQNLSPEAVNYFNANPDLIIKDTESIKIPVKGTTESKQMGLDDLKSKNFNHVQLTGITDQADPVRQGHIKDFIDLVNEGKLQRELYITKDSSIVPHIESVNKDRAVADQYNPQNVLEAFYVHPDTNEIRIVGTIPTEKRIGEIIISPDGKKTVKGAKNSQNETLVKNNRPTFLDHTANNETWAAEMNRLGIKTMKVNVDPFYEAIQGANIGNISEQAYLHISTSDSLWREAKYRNRNVADPKTMMTQDAIKSWREQVVRGETPVEMKSPEATNAEFEQLVKMKKMNIPEDLLSQFTPTEKALMIRDYYTRNTPKLAKTIIETNPEKPAAVKQAETPVIEAATAKSNELPFENVPKAPDAINEAKTALPQGEEVFNTPERQATEKAAMDFFGPSEKIPAKPEVKPEEVPAFARTPEEQKAVESTKKTNVIWGKKETADVIIQPEYDRLIQSGEKQKAIELKQKSRQILNKEDLTLRAKKAMQTVLNDAETEPTLDAGFGVFRKSLLDDFKSITGNKDMAELPNESDLRKKYLKMARQFTRKSVVVGNPESPTKVVEADPNVIGRADQKILQDNAANHKPKTNMEIAGVDKESAALTSKLTPKGAIDKIDNSFYEVDPKHPYVLVGKTKKGAENLLAIKYDSDKVDVFNSDPERYSNKGEKLTDEDKFRRVIFRDIFGLRKEELTDSVIGKRGAIIFNRYDKTPGKDASINVHIISDTPIRETDGIDSSVLANLNNPETKATLEKHLNAAHNQGVTYVGSDIADTWGLDPGKIRNTQKAAGMIELPNGETLYVKGMLVRLDPATEAYLKELHPDLKIGKNSVITVGDNIKIGDKTPRTIKTKLSNFYTQSAEHGKPSKIGPSFVGGKFTASDNTAQGWIEKDVQNMAKHSQLVDDFQKAKTNEDYSKAISKAFGKDTTLDSEIANIQYDEPSIAYGTTAKKIQYGGGEKTVSFALRKFIKNFFTDNVYKPEIKNSQSLTLVPNIKMALDSADKPTRFLTSDETGIGAKLAKKLNIKDGEEVMIKREPVNDPTSLLIVKARVVDDMGATSLGEEGIMLNSTNSYLRLLGDQDGDAPQIYKIGGKDGIPKSVADAVKKQGKVVSIAEATKRPSQMVTTENLKDNFTKQLIGDRQTGAVATQSRIVNTLMDNNIQIFVKDSIQKSGTTKAGKGYTYDINPYEIHTLNPKTGAYDILIYSGEERGNSPAFIAKPSWDNAKEKLKKQLSTYAQDSKGSDDIVSATASKYHKDGNDPLFVLKNVFEVKDADGKIINVESTDMPDMHAKTLNNIMQKTYQPMFRLADPDEISKIRDITGVQKYLAEPIAIAEKLKASGAKLNPMQERLLQFKDIKDLKNFTDQDYLAADNGAYKAVSSQSKNIVKSISPDEDKIVKEIENLAAKNRSAYERIGKDKSMSYTDKSEQKVKLHKEVVDLYSKYFEEGKLSQDAVDNLAFWAATSPNGDIAWGPNSTRRYVRRYDEMITDSPTVASIYYPAYESAPLAKDVSPQAAGISRSQMIGHTLAGTEISGKALPAKPNISYKNLGK